MHKKCDVCGKSLEDKRYFIVVNIDGSQSPVCNINCAIKVI